MRIAGVLLLLWWITLPCLAQTNATKDPTALTALAQMVAATGWNPATLPVDATATATVTTYEGDTQNTQSITIQVKGLREILVQSSAGSSVVNNDQAAYTDERGPHLLASYSAMSIQAIELPFLTSLMNFNASNVSVQSLGTDTVNGQATEKVLISPQPFPNDSIGQLRAKAWTDPLGNLTSYEFTTDSQSSIPIYPWVAPFSPREIQRQIYQGSSTLLRTIQTCYDNLSSCPTPASDSGATLPVEITTTLNDVSPPLVAQTQMVYDTYTPPGGSAIPIDNVIQKSDYDYGSNAPGALLRKTNYTWLKTNSVNGTDYTQDPIHILNRKASETIYNSSSTQLAYTVYEYDNYTAGISASGAVQHDSTFTTSYTYRGNLTATERWRNTDGATLTTRNQYDNAGNILSTTDPKSNTTKFSYADSWANSACTPSGGNGAAYLTSTTNALTQITSHTYNSCSGTIATTTDPNEQLTTFTYDLMGRLVQTKDPDGGLITPCYTDAGGTGCTKTAAPLEVVTTTEISASQNKISTVVADGLGRTVQTQLNSDPSGVDYVNTTYDGDGRVSSVSNPYRTTSDPTYGITSYIYDGLNRKLQVTDSDGSTVTTSYCGTGTAVKDEAGKWRRSITNGLDQMVEVDEPSSASSTVSACPGTGGPVNTTTYSYDALNNLLGVVQVGSHQRTFTYDSLSELLTAQNPGTGTASNPTITYTYDNDGNMATRLDARGITTTYSYDALNRLTSKVYSNGDPTRTYVYDGDSPCASIGTFNYGLPVGRRTMMCDGEGTENWSYDSMGRILTDQRTTNSVTKSTVYTYTPYVDGSIASITYPSGLAITYTYDNAGRPISATDSSGVKYATTAVYAPQGAISTITIGDAGSFTGVNVSDSYNERLQPVEMKATSSAGTAMDLTFNFSLGAGDNGDVTGTTNNLDST